MQCSYKSVTLFQCQRSKVTYCSLIKCWDSTFLLQLNLSKVIIASPLKPGCFAVFLQAAKYRLGLCLDIWDVKQLSPLVHPKGGKEERVRDISEHSRHRQCLLDTHPCAITLRTFGHTWRCTRCFL